MTTNRRDETRQEDFRACTREDAMSSLSILGRSTKQSILSLPQVQQQTTADERACTLREKGTHLRQKAGSRVLYLRTRARLTSQKGSMRCQLSGRIAASIQMGLDPISPNQPRYLDTDDIEVLHAGTQHTAFVGYCQRKNADCAKFQFHNLYKEDPPVNLNPHYKSWIKPKNSITGVMPEYNIIYSKHIPKEDDQVSNDLRGSK